MIILGIETSCDDTSVALVEATKTGFVVLSEKTASQIEVHKKYGGVVPEIAGRCHAENILPVIEEVLKDGPKPEVIAVTSGPGLVTGLLVGITAAKTLSYLWDIPIVSMNHIEGHIHSVLLNQEKTLQFPALCLTVSGGHTELILAKNWGEYELVGKTGDDAAGECFDKVGKLVGFEYPGGPKVSKHAEEGNPKTIKFPRPMLNKNNFDFSFSGLKTAALYWLRDNHVIASEAKQSNTDGEIATSPSTPRNDFDLNDFCASFEQAIVDVLVTKTRRAAEKLNPKTVILAGGVSANKKLRLSLKRVLKDYNLLTPDPTYSMDNAAMIATAAYHHALKKDFTPWQDIKADPNWKVYN